jgi:LuxR family maltose regulon positive regulatory protein
MTGKSKQEMQNTVLLVDDHPVFRKGLRSLLEYESDMQVVGEAGDGQEALALVRELSPTIVVMDVTMPGLSGTATVERIVSEFPDMKIVALSIHSEKQFVRDMLRAGASGYILKESAPEELVQGIRAVMLGEGYLSPAITGLVVSEYRSSLPGDRDIDKADMHIVRTKLQRPPVPADHVPRQRLLEMLSHHRDLPLILLSAPAGYGKTTLISSWLQACDCPSAWLSLDKEDNDLRVFLTYFVSAVRAMFPDALQETGDLLNAHVLPPLSVLTASLANDLDMIEQDFILAMDDFHLVEDRSVHALLSDLLRHPPTRMHLVVVGRRDPFLPVSSLRARRQVKEIRAREMRFNSSETMQYLQKTLKERVEEGTAEELSEKTEGWITGLRLAAVSMRHRGDVGSLLLGMEGNHQYVTEYLFNEVLSHQSSGARDLLMNIAVLDRFCAPLCGAVCEPGQDAMEPWEFIALLKRENLFIASLDTEDRWFRLHSLFRQLLQNQLRRHRSPVEIAALHSRAGKWFEENDLVEDAVRHALAAGDALAAAQVVERNRRAALDADRWQEVGTWLGRLPREIKEERPDLLLGKAWVQFMSAWATGILPIIEHVESLLSEDPKEPAPLAEVSFFRGLLCYCQGEGARGAELFTKAADLLPEGSFPALRAEAECWTCVALHLDGQKETAVRRLREKVRTRDLQEGIILSRLTFGLCFIHMLDGEWLKAFQEGLQVRDVCRSNRLASAETWGMYVQGNASLQMFDLEAARHHFGQVAEKRHIANRRIAVDAMAGLAIASQFMGEPGEADETMRLAEEYAQRTKDPACLEIVASCRARLALLRGDLVSASRWQRSLSETPGTPLMLFFLENPAITECRVLISTGSDAGLKEAVERLEDLRQRSNAWHNTCQTMEILVLQALASHRGEGLEEALEVLKRAVAMAMPGGSVRLFVEAGPPVEHLLKSVARDGTYTDFARLLLSAMGDSKKGAAREPRAAAGAFVSAQPLVEPLTGREIDLLEQLAQRFSNNEIAENLFISTATVKTHLKSIFQKLDVANRREAVARAVELGFLQ